MKHFLYVSALTFLFAAGCRTTQSRVSEAKRANCEVKTQIIEAKRTDENGFTLETLSAANIGNGTSGEQTQADCQTMCSNVDVNDACTRAKGKTIRTTCTWDGDSTSVVNSCL